MFQPLPAEPLARTDDALEFAAGLACRKDGSWSDGQWTGFRVRYGVYGQRQSGKHMVRIKVPGGIVAADWLPAIAKAMRDFTDGPAHLSTRQDIQLYGVDLDETLPLLEHLYRHGVTTREAGGNGIRNVTACAQAGFCPAEKIDSGRLAQKLAGLWLRAPLAQRMPRKFKIAVSGCEKDCAGGWFHDLAFVPAYKNGANGFRVLGGGGLGARPMPGIELFDFVVEEDLPAVIEAVLRVHQHRSDRANKSVSRFKFTIRRLNAKEIQEEVKREFAVARQLPQRPLSASEWKPGEGEKPAVIAGPRKVATDFYAVVARPVNGQLAAEQFDGLHEITQTFGLDGIRITATQEVVLLGVSQGSLKQAQAWLARLGLPEVKEEAPRADVMGCLGTSTCPIGIVNAWGLSRELAEVTGTENLKIRVSGCHNACAQHHVADIGFHGLTRIVNDRPVPHYQIHLGGDMARPDGLALEGPTIPARNVPDVLERLANVYHSGRLSNETVREWAERLGEAGVAELVRADAIVLDQQSFVDWGETEPFKGPATGKSDCSAPQVSNDHLADLAKDALERMDRALLAGLWELALHEGERAIRHSALRRLEMDSQPAARSLTLPVIDGLRTALRYRPELLDGLEQLESARHIALVTGKAYDYRDSIADWLEAVETVKPLSPITDENASRLVAAS